MVPACSSGAHPRQVGVLDSPGCARRAQLAPTGGVRLSSASSLDSSERWAGGGRRGGGRGGCGTWRPSGRTFWPRTIVGIDRSGNSGSPGRSFGPMFQAAARIATRRIRLPIAMPSTYRPRDPTCWRIPPAACPRRGRRGWLALPRALARVAAGPGRPGLAEVDGFAALAALLGGRAADYCPQANLSSGCRSCSLRCRHHRGARRRRWLIAEEAFRRSASCCTRRAGSASSCGCCRAVAVAGPATGGRRDRRAVHGVLG